ncbi:MAG TPA: NapC/NirT family cytochrome c [Bacteroidales bacterium]|nr:NapC/NirT family cytochrome c [Bacteroidales bacterium]HPI85440.1 NapC/NirT family cytochrome c [Bacteroidales bacterium]HPM91510.1 NapC/NirT family cytochrome c [Bacteroidales bacterium]
MKLKNLKLPASFYNWTSIIGATIALISLFMIVFLFVITSILNQGGSYIGVVIYIALPALLVIGLLMIPIGMIIKYRRNLKKTEKTELRWPAFDFNEPRQRNAFMIFSVGSTIFLLLSAVGSYEAFHYTESVEFCGTLCHEVMKPEYTAYQNSPHARVACVDCHVGAGADWYVRSKLSGLYQVYSVTFDLYPRPIPVPIRNLRPARETCEECHWPEKFYARQLRIERHYLTDSDNTEWDIHLQMKTGPSLSALGLQEGIHWHINPDISVEYVATSDDREVIPWVRYTNKKTGEVQIYEDASNPLEPGQIDTLEIRQMDCMDCHNRPSHNYQTPIYAINAAITAGKIPRDLPDIKFQAMQVMNATYSTTDSAMMGIEKGIREYYSTVYEELYNSNPEKISQAIDGIREAFSKNIFPEMKVKWSAYPNHIGHLEFNGCFRCHNNNHSTAEGRTISMDCNLCHSIVAQGTPGDMQVITNLEESLEFFHQTDPDGNWKDALCSDCHRDLY